MSVKIYALCDPETKEVRYIGKTVQTLKERLRAHLRENHFCHKTNWVKSLSCEPIISLIEECADEIWEERERFWIDCHKRTGRLTNTRGGGGGLDTHTTQARQRISTKLTGRTYVPSPRHREAMRLAGLARRGKSNLKLIGRKATQETKDKISAAHKGRPSHMRGQKQPDWLIQKRVESRLGNATNNKPVIHVLTQEIYASALRACRALGIPETSFRRKLALGIEWKRVEL